MDPNLIDPGNLEKNMSSYDDRALRFDHIN